MSHGPARYYYKARMYSPELGRFLQTDPIGYEDQQNLYAYVANDPVNSRDNDGRQSQPVDLRQEERKRREMIRNQRQASQKNRGGRTVSAVSAVASAASNGLEQVAGASQNSTVSTAAKAGARALNAVSIATTVVKADIAGDPAKAAGDIGGTVVASAAGGVAATAAAGITKNSGAAAASGVVTETVVEPIAGDIIEYMAGAVVDAASYIAEGISILYERALPEEQDR